MEERFEVGTMLDFNNIYDKLHKEIILFRKSVHDILNEIQPIKEFLIEKVAEVIKKSVPGSDV